MSIRAVSIYLLRLPRLDRRLQDERDRALATDLVTGTLRWQRQIDHLIAHFAKRPPAKLDFEVLQILRLGIYQLLHLDRVPASAAVNDAVAMTRRARKTSAAGLVNAVLRSISRNSHRLPLPPRPPDGEPLAYLEVSLSHPGWLARRWLDRYGFDAAEAWEQFNNTPSPLTLRVNRLKSDSEMLVKALASTALTSSRRATHRTVSSSNRAIRCERHLRAPASSSCRTKPRSSWRCSARQNPACACSIRAPHQAARRPPWQRWPETVRRSSQQTCAARASRSCARPSTPAALGISGFCRPISKPVCPSRREFDIVFVDAPCSGLGTVRRDPDIRWRRTEADLAPLRTRAVDDDSSRRGGGPSGWTARFIPPVPASRRRTTRSFRRSSRPPYFTAVDLNVERPAQFGALEPVLDDTGVLRTLPHKHGLEAFFGAVLRRVK